MERSSIEIWQYHNAYTAFSISAVVQHQSLLPPDATSQFLTKCPPKKQRSRDFKIFGAPRRAGIANYPPMATASKILRLLCRWGHHSCVKFTEGAVTKNTSVLRRWHISAYLTYQQAKYCHHWTILLVLLIPCSKTAAPWDCALWNPKIIYGFNDVRWKMCIKLVLSYKLPKIYPWDFYPTQ